MILLQSRSRVSNDDAVACPDLDDAHLVALAKGGDPAAFTQLYRRYVDRVYAFMARRLADRAAAEEATQETFVRALTGLGGCRTDAAFAGWLFAIARHVVTEHDRARRRIRNASEASLDREDPDPAPEEHSIRAEAASALRDARERCLGHREQALLDLLLADLTDVEIATALGRRNGAVRMARWRLMRKLRDCPEIRGQQVEVSHVAR